VIWAVSDGGGAVTVGAGAAPGAGENTRINDHVTPAAATTMAIR